MTRIIVGVFGYINTSVASIIGNVCGLVNILFAVLVIMGIVNAVKGRAKELPVIGKITILK